MFHYAQQCRFPLAINLIKTAKITGHKYCHEKGELVQEFFELVFRTEFHVLSSKLDHTEEIWLKSLFYFRGRHTAS